jgi:D-3-phosphoglycerate dehydrogenase
MTARVLVTAPPMLGAISTFEPILAGHGLEVVAPAIVQAMAEAELVAIVPRVDAWIAGDCPVSRRVMEAGLGGRLRAIVKWGVGVDNVDFAAARELGLPVANTPGVFGNEVADVALGYVIALARQTHLVDRGVRGGAWPKPAGLSLCECRAALVGYGDIGRAIAHRLLACGMRVTVYDPAATAAGPGCEIRRWPDGLEGADVLVLACALTPATRHLVDARALARCKPGVRIVNVARGALIDERALEDALDGGHVHSAALDVFETEPLPAASRLRRHERCVFGSHNASNTIHGVARASHRAIEVLLELLARSRPARTAGGERV